MSGQHPVIAYDVAISLQEGLLHQAEAGRLAACADADRPVVVDRLRRRAGQALVRLGERLESTHRRSTGDLAAASGVLRISR
ncbi:MAG: hypothetical protein QOJ59_835 [Thermomicrobiales bacterium]|jgi:hypothetical protein|nr:hypothetical protein [Thermomicrobiales bacterium]